MWETAFWLQGTAATRVGCSRGTRGGETATSSMMRTPTTMYDGARFGSSDESVKPRRRDVETWPIFYESKEGETMTVPKVTQKRSRRQSMRCNGRRAAMMPKRRRRRESARGSAGLIASRSSPRGDNRQFLRPSRNACARRARCWKRASSFHPKLKKPACSARQKDPTAPTRREAS